MSTTPQRSRSFSPPPVTKRAKASHPANPVTNVLKSSGLMPAKNITVLRIQNSNDANRAASGHAQIVNTSLHQVPSATVVQSSQGSQSLTPGTVQSMLPSSTAPSLASLQATSSNAQATNIPSALSGTMFLPASSSQPLPLAYVPPVGYPYGFPQSFASGQLATAGPYFPLFSNAAIPPTSSPPNPAQPSTSQFAPGTYATQGYVPSDPNHANILYSLPLQPQPSASTVPLYSGNAFPFHMSAYAPPHAPLSSALHGAAPLHPPPSNTSTAQASPAQGMLSSEDIKVLRGAPHALTSAPIHPIDRFVSLDDIDTIQSGKFLNLDRLLGADIPESKTVIEVDSEGRYHVVVDRAVPKKPKISSILEWNHAWSIYTTVMLRNCRLTADIKIRLCLDMLAYREHINTMATDNADWHYYDSCFRRLLPGSALSFNEIEVMLWLKACRPSTRALTNDKALGGVGALAGAARPSRPAVSEELKRNRSLARSRLANYNMDATLGFCWVFMADLPCDNACVYKHFCPSPACLGAVHSILRCPNTRPKDQPFPGLAPPPSNSQVLALPPASGPASFGDYRPHQSFQHPPPPISYPPPRF